MEVDLKRMRHLVAIDELRSFSQAADALAITQPALSRSVATLEQALGIRIFDRDRSGVVPTAAGAALIAEARLVLAQARALERNVAEWRDAEAGEIAIGAGPLMASIILPLLLSRAATTRPRLKLSAVVQSASALIDALQADQIEFCLTNRMIVPPLSHLEIETLGHVPIGLFVRRGHALAGRSGLKREDVSGFPLASGASPVTIVPEIMPEQKLPPPTIICENYHILADVMLTSDVVWITSRTLVDRIAPGQAEELVVPRLQLPPLDVCSVTLRHRTMSSASRLLHEWIREIFGGAAQDQAN